jgi:SAM-dependent methyltransferase
MSTQVPSTPVYDPEKLNAFVGRMLGDIGAVATAVNVIVGDRLGLYRALRDHGPQTAAELAQHTGTNERNVREWLANQAASGYVDVDTSNGRFSLPSEHAAIFADELSPVNMCGLFDVLQTLFIDEPKVTESFRTGSGVGWDQRDAQLFTGTNRFFTPAYRAHLVGEWIPALDGVEQKLRAGARVADIGSGFGTSTILMAQAFPASTFIGFDYHAGSVAAANQAAKDAGVAERVHFAVASAQAFPGENYDLIACFDCIHDMGDPVGAASRILKALAPDGTFLMVEPFAHDRLEDNLNPVGRIFYGVSSMVCTPASLAQEGALGLGAQAGEARLRAVFEEAGFGSFRRATETPFHLVFEGRR